MFELQSMEELLEKAKQSTGQGPVGMPLQPFTASSPRSSQVYDQFMSFADAVLCCAVMSLD